MVAPGCPGLAHSFIRMLLDASLGVTELDRVGQGDQATWGRWYGLWSQAAAWKSGHHHPSARPWAAM